MNLSSLQAQAPAWAFNMSFGECEFSAYIDGAMLVDDEVFAQAALQGITPFASADDQAANTYIF